MVDNFFEFDGVVRFGFFHDFEDFFESYWLFGKQ